MGNNQDSTLEKRLFSIFWAIDNFRASGSVLWSIVLLCMNRSKKNIKLREGKSLNSFWWNSGHKN
jgi:hypothetical protein